MKLMGILMGFLLYLEIIYHLGCFGLSFSNPLLTIALTMIVASLETLLIGKLPRKWKKRVFWLVVGLEYVVFAAQFVYYFIFKQPMLLEAIVLGGGDALTNYWREALQGVLGALPFLILMALPLVVIGVLMHQRILRMPILHSLQVLRQLVLAGVGMIFAISFVLIGKYIEADYYEEYSEFFDPLTVVENMGVTTMIQRDTAMNLGNLAGGLWDRLTRKDSRGEGSLGSLAAGKEELDPSEITGSDPMENTDESSVGENQDPETNPGEINGAESENPPGESGNGEPAEEDPVEEEPPLDTSPHEFPIDWAKLQAEAASKEETWLASYMPGLVPTTKNEYTGIFKGYNLIFLTAEGFCPYAVREDLTPTLYRLTHTGFVFTNYYVPLWNTSTSDGAYINTTGLIPDGQFSMRKSGANDMAFSLPHYFNTLGTQSMAYHDNSLSYYDRHVSHPNLGYYFKAAKLGDLSEEEWGDHIFPMEHPNQWPASDLEMMQGTIPEYINEDIFHVYYMTVSGHMNYNFTGNSMSYKNREAVADLEMSENARAYIACHIELDKALEYLLQELENAGKLENTVICMSADHYPYAMTAEQYDELAGKSVSNSLDLYRNNLILWNASMESDPVIVDKVCGSMDLLPTLLNLFGFEYDSRLFAGKDIFSQDEGMVIFKDRSFITDTVAYNKSDKSATYRADLKAAGGLVDDIAGYVTEQGVSRILDNLGDLAVRIPGRMRQLDSQEARDQYLEACQQEVKDRYQFSAYILRNDYYHDILEALPEDYSFR